MTPMICIDFGNSYTKVSIRRDQNSAAQLMRDPGLHFDELNLCVPTLAACDPGQGHRWHFGLNVVRLGEQHKTSQVFRNWKPLFFEENPPTLSPPPRLQAAAVPVPASVPSGRLTDFDWNEVRDILQLSDAVRDRFEGVVWAMRDPAPPPVTAVTQPIDLGPAADIDLRAMAIGYFEWLRTELVTPFCHKHGLPGAEAVPTRITLPSFGGMNKAAELLGIILEEAGWCLDQTMPTLAEPLANALGIFTEGKNGLRTVRDGTVREGTFPNYALMFRQTGLAKAIHAAAVGAGPKLSWALIIDLGGYTTDCAMIGFHLDELDGRLDGTIDGKRQTMHRSEKLGVVALDRRIQSILNEAQYQAVERMLNDTNPDQLESFHRTLYGQLKPYNLGKAGRIGASRQMDQVRACIDQFADEIATFADRFLQTGQYDQIDDLILTGGGMMIPPIREYVTSHLRHYFTDRTQLHMHFPQVRVPKNGHALDQVLIRGATALGGASVFFDFLQESATTL